jgi:hypothetical protein
LALRKGLIVFAAGIIAPIHLIDVTAARAAGVAIALGQCDNFGWAYNPDVGVARRNAMQACGKNGDTSCKIVASGHGCAAIAISGKCDGRGWAWGPTRARAEALALEYCARARHGGPECTVRKWVCPTGAGGPAPKPSKPAPSPKPSEPAPSPKPSEPAPSPKPSEPAPSPTPRDPACKRFPNLC